MPARPQYSSVRRGSNMRRKLTLPVEPPVPMMTALRARIFNLAPLWSTAMPSTGPEFGVCRWIEVIRCSSRISTPAFLAATSSDRISPLPEERVFCTAGIGRLPGIRHRPVHHGRVHFTRHRISDRVSAKRIWRLVDKDDPVGNQPFEGGGTVVREGANDFAVVVPVVRESRWGRPPTSRSGRETAGPGNLQCRISSARWFRRRAEHCRH